MVTLVDLGAIDPVPFMNHVGAPLVDCGVTSENPPPVVPTPASLFPDLRGRRVIVGVPGIGFRNEPTSRRSRGAAPAGRFVPVLTEQDYYRAEIEQIEVFAPLVPIDRVWVEQLAAW